MKYENIIATILIVAIVGVVVLGAISYSDNNDQNTNPTVGELPQYGGELIGTITVDASESFSQAMTVSVHVSIYTGEPTSASQSWVDVSTSSTTQLNISGTAPSITGTYICIVYYVTEIGDCYDFVMIQVN